MFYSGAFVLGYRNLYSVELHVFKHKYNRKDLYFQYPRVIVKFFVEGYYRNFTPEAL